MLLLRNITQIEEIIIRFVLTEHVIVKLLHALSNYEIAHVYELKIKCKL
jgi:hypothetical protein